MPAAALAASGAVAADLDRAAVARQLWDRLSPLLGEEARRDYRFTVPGPAWTDAAAERPVERGTVKIGHLAASGLWRVKATLDGERVYFARDIPGDQLRRRTTAAVALLLNRQHPEGF